MAANLTQILNFKANFHQEFELFKKKTLKIVSIIKKTLKMIDSIPKKNSAFCLKTSYFMNK